MAKSKIRTIKKGIVKAIMVKKEKFNKKFLFILKIFNLELK
jgi:hypothetical protein